MYAACGGVSQPHFFQISFTMRTPPGLCVEDESEKSAFRQKMSMGRAPGLNEYLKSGTSTPFTYNFVPYLLSLEKYMR